MKSSQVDILRRREKLIQLLGENEELSVNQLASYFGVSPVTIRRDFLFLEKKKLINRFYGGAQAIKDGPLDYRNLSNEQTFPVNLFVDRVRSSLRENMTVYVSSGIFSTEIIYALSYFEILIITNNPSAMFINHSEKKARICISGGELEKDANALVGNLAIYSFSKNNADICIIEASGFNTHEVTTSTLNESLIYRTMIHHTKGKKIVYTPSSNLEIVSAFMIDKTFMFDTLYTDEKILPSVLSLYLKNKISVIPLKD